MQKEHTPMNGEGASLSRRNFITIAAAGTAATLPAVALAGASGKTSRLPQPSEPVPAGNALPLEAQFDDCIARLRDVLSRMHPGIAGVPSDWLSSNQDGSFEFYMRGKVKFAEFAGDGLYEISLSGHLSTWWLEQDCHVSRVTGEPLPGMIFYRATYWEDGELAPDSRDMYSPNIVRKLDWVPA